MKEIYVRTKLVNGTYVYAPKGTKDTYGTVLIDNDTGEFLKVAPIFDNGFSLFYGASNADLQQAYHEEYKKSLRCKYLSLDDQAHLFVNKRHLPSLRKLLKFRFKRHPKYNIAEETLQLMEALIRERAKKTLAMYP